MQITRQTIALLVVATFQTFGSHRWLIITLSAHFNPISGLQTRELIRTGKRKNSCCLIATQARNFWVSPSLWLPVFPSLQPIESETSQSRRPTSKESRENRLENWQGWDWNWTTISKAIIKFSPLFFYLKTIRKELRINVRCFEAARLVRIDWSEKNKEKSSRSGTTFESL